MDLNYKTFGQGDPLIILHGLFGTLDNWQTVARQLSNHYSVYIVDLRNHGRSPHADEAGYPAMAEDLKVFMENHWIYKAHIMGHSMGGKTAMQLALDYPEMVDKLVVVDIAPKGYKGGHETIFKALFAVDMDALEDRSQAEKILAAYIDDNGVVQFLLKNLTRKKEGGYEWKMNLPVLFRDYDKIVGAIEGHEAFEHPALFIRGEKSTYILDEDWPAILELFPAARLETVLNAGHWVHANNPAAMLSLVENFLYSS